MYYIKLAFKAVFRLRKYTVPLFLAMLIAISVMTATVNIHIGTENLTEEIESRYTVTVRLLLYRPLSQSQSSSSGEYKIFDYNEIEPFFELPYIEDISFTSDISNFRAYLWQFAYRTEDFKKEEYISIDDEMMTEAFSATVKMSEYAYIDLLEGEHLENDMLNEDGSIPVLISSALAEKFSYSVGDRFSVSLDEQDEHFLADYNSVFYVKGIFDYGSSYYMYLPFCAAMEKHLTISEDSEKDISDEFDALDPVFILSSPGDAEKFVSDHTDYFMENGFVLSADDYEYKKELYPAKMMLDLNDIIGTLLIVVALVMLMLLTVQSVNVRDDEIAALRLLSMKKGMILSNLIAEKLIILISSSVLGIIIGIAVSLNFYSDTVKESLPYVIAGTLTIIFILVLISTAIILRKAAKSPLRVMANEK